MVGRSIEKPKLELDVGLDRARTRGVSVDSNQTTHAKT